MGEYSVYPVSTDQVQWERIPAVHRFADRFRDADRIGTRIVMNDFDRRWHIPRDGT